MNRDEPILIVEDEVDDMLFLKMAFDSAGITNPIQEAADCESAIEFLSGKGKYADRAKFPLPGLVLLDLRLPDKSGVEVLRTMRNLKLEKMNVIVFTSSSNMADVRSAYDAGATSYVVKPLSTAERKDFAALVRDYWLGYNHSLTV